LLLVHPKQAAIAIDDREREAAEDPGANERRTGGDLVLDARSQFAIATLRVDIILRPKWLRIGQEQHKSRSHHNVAALHGNLLGYRFSFDRRVHFLTYHLGPPPPPKPSVRPNRGMPGAKVPDGD